MTEADENRDSSFRKTSGSAATCGRVSLTFAIVSCLCRRFVVSVPNKGFFRSKCRECNGSEELSEPESG